MMENEKLDFCRIKKIFDKGFGFLSSVYYETDVFFHFSKIRDLETREKLEHMKRGEVYAFFTSKGTEGKRKVSRIWTELKKVDKKLIPDFISKIIDELNTGDTNLYEMAHVVKMLKENRLLTKNEFKAILLTSKIIKNPFIISAMLSDDENKDLDDVIELMTTNKIDIREGMTKISNGIHFG